MKKAQFMLPVAGIAVGAMAIALALVARSPAPEQGAAATAPSAPATEVSPPGVQVAAARAAVSPSPAPAAGAPTPGLDTLETRLASALSEWRQAEVRIADLQARLVRVERRLSQAQEQQQTPVDAEPRARRPRSAAERREAMVEAGVDPGLADEIVWRESRIQLERLELRDQAVREGWMGTDRYREELERADADEQSLREQIGDNAWDRYLYVTGADNRVQVAAVIPGSAAEASGVQAGDVIENYAGERVFDFGDLRGLTADGEAGELVLVRVERGGEAGEVWVPRGPLGVRLEAARTAP